MFVHVFCISHHVCNLMQAFIDNPEHCLIVLLFV